MSWSASPPPKPTTRKSIPKATNQVIYRILIFYIGSLAILLSLYPWGKVVEGGSPFVLIFHALNSNLVATVLNIVVLTAALSVYNSCVYCNSRMLYGGAAGQWPEKPAEGRRPRRAGGGHRHFRPRHRAVRTD